MLSKLCRVSIYKEIIKENFTQKITQSKICKQNALNRWHKENCTKQTKQSNLRKVGWPEPGTAQPKVVYYTVYLLKK